MSDSTGTLGVVFPPLPAERAEQQVLKGGQVGLLKHLEAPGVSSPVFNQRAVCPVTQEKGSWSQVSKKPFVQLFTLLLRPCAPDTGNKAPVSGGQEQSGGRLRLI